jgi:hypothetical protein
MEESRSIELELAENSNRKVPAVEVLHDILQRWR